MENSCQQTADKDIKGAVASVMPVGATYYIMISSGKNVKEDSRNFGCVSARSDM